MTFAARFAKRGAAREVLGEAPGVVRLTVGQFDANFRPGRIHRNVNE